MTSIRTPDEVDPAFEPAPGDVAAKAAAAGVGPDTAAVLVRRDTIKALRDTATAKVATYKGKTGADADLGAALDAVLAVMNATIAATFDA